MTLISIHDLSLRYHDKLIFQGLNLDLHPGEVIGIRGTSGCGKSSLIHCIANIIPSLIDGKISGSIDTNDHSLGVAFQNPDSQLFFQTLEEELAFGMENHCYSKSQMEHAITEVLKLMNLTSYRHTNPNQLSGGEKQLVVLACALVLKPKILLLDEALSQVDDTHIAILLPYLKKYANDGNGILFVDHKPEHFSICSSIYTMENHTLRKEL